MIEKPWWNSGGMGGNTNLQPIVTEAHPPSTDVTSQETQDIRDAGRLGRMEDIPRIRGAVALFGGLLLMEGALATLAISSSHLGDTGWGYAGIALFVVLGVLPAVYAGYSEAALAIVGAAATAWILAGIYGTSQVPFLGLLLLLMAGVVVLGLGLTEWTIAFRLLSDEDRSDS